MGLPPLKLHTYLFINYKQTAEAMQYSTAVPGASSTVLVFTSQKKE